MQNNQIPDSALSASSSHNVNSMGPGNGRLYFQANSGKYGAWAASKNDEFQWFAVDFGNYAKVTGLATQGRQDGNWWVVSYSLSFSHDGVFFEDYKENNIKKACSIMISIKIKYQSLLSINLNSGCHLILSFYLLHLYFLSYRLF